MAGILSKGITLSMKKNATLYSHAFKSTGDEFTIITDSSDALYADIRANKPTIIGATLIYKGVSCEIVSYTYNAEIFDVVCLNNEHDASTHGIYFESSAAETITVYGTSESDDFVALANLQEIPELGNNAPEKIDITVLSDGAKKSISGLGDTAQDLAFKFLYEKEQFDLLSAITGSCEWCVTLPDGTTATFTATPSVKLAGVGVSAALTYTLNLSVESEIVFA